MAQSGFFPPERDFCADIADIADKSMFPMVLAFFTPDKAKVVRDVRGSDRIMAGQNHESRISG
jgi:hypothetical protein